MPHSTSSRIHRHTLSARICHWVMALSFFYLLYSGVMIFLHFPELYWGKVGFQGYPAIFKLEDWGISWEQAERLGDRRWGRNYHYLFAWVFLINGMVYLLWNGWRKSFYQKMLPKLSNNTNPYFLLVEASQIDWGGHKNDIDYVLSEFIDMNEAINKVLEFTKNDKNTIVIVTGDHETGGLAIISGRIRNFQMKTEFSTIGHSAAMIPVFMVEQARKFEGFKGSPNGSVEFV